MPRSLTPLIAAENADHLAHGDGNGPQEHISSKEQQRSGEKEVLHFFNKQVDKLINMIELTTIIELTTNLQGAKVAQSFGFCNFRIGIF